MTEWYNLTNFSDQDTFLGIFKVANSYTQGMFGTLILLGLFVIVFVVMSRYEAKHRMTVAAWLTALVGVLYVPLGMVNTWVVYLMFIIIVGGTIALFYD